MRLQNDAPTILHVYNKLPRNKISLSWYPDLCYGSFLEGMQRILWGWIVVITLGTSDKYCKANIYEGTKCWALSLGNSSNTYNKLAVGTSVFWPPLFLTFLRIQAALPFVRPPPTPHGQVDIAELDDWKVIEWSLGSLLPPRCSWMRAVNSLLVCQSLSLQPVPLLLQVAYKTCLYSPFVLVLKETTYFSFLSFGWSTLQWRRYIKDSGWIPLYWKIPHNLS